MAGQAFGVIGLEVMGRNIALNIERNGFPIAVFNRTYSKTQAFLEGPAKGKNAKGAERIEDFVRLLTRPRRVLMMVKASIRSAPLAFLPLAGPSRSEEHTSELQSPMYLVF